MTLETAPQGRERARWSRLAAVAMLLVAVGPALMLLAVVLFGVKLENQHTMRLLTSLAIAVVGALLVWRFGGWAKILGVLAIIVAAGGIFWTVFGLFFFQSFFDFMPGLLVLPGAVLAIVACVAALIAGGRGHRTPAAIGGERTAIRVVLGVVALAAMITAIITFVGRTNIEAERASEVITMSDFRFDDTSYEFAPAAKVLVRNNDPFVHTFTIDALDIDEALTAGDEVLVGIPNRAGRYVLFCRPHTSDPQDPEYGEDMAAHLTIGEVG